MDKEGDVRVTIPMVLSWVAGAVGAQIPVTHAAGIVLPVDFEGDGKDEFVVLGGTLRSHSYTALHASSMIVPGPAQQLSGQVLVDQPVINDRTLFVITLGAQRRQIEITSYGVQGNAWFAVHSTRAYPSVADPIATVRAAPFHRDLDGDGRRDLLVAWTEAGNGTSSTYCLVHSPTRSTPPLTIRPPAFAPAEARVLLLHRSTSPSLRTDEYLLGFSATSEDPWGGFGFVLLYDGTTQAGGTWFPMLPTLLLDEFPVLEDEPMAYGRFSPFPWFGVPLVKASTGRSARLGLDPTEPFVARRGDLLSTSLRGKQLPRCIADYDGNGVQEMVWIEYLYGNPHPYLIATDPGPNGREIHVVPLQPRPGEGPVHVHHGATGDFDGDGDPDIVLSVQRAHPQPGSGLMYIRNDRDHRRRSTLRRVQ